jgi:hypothetical protein
VIALAALDVADPPDAWRRLGFDVGEDGTARVGRIDVRLGRDGSGLVGWELSGADGPPAIDGLPTAWTRAPAPAAAPAHPNGATGVDHVVALTDDLDWTLGAVCAAGLDVRRIRDAGHGRRQAFVRVGDALLELVGPAGAAAAFWGIVVVVADLDALARRLGPRLGTVRDAVQPGRRIATVRPDGALGDALAFMSVRVQ